MQEMPVPKGIDPPAIHVADLADSMLPAHS